MVIIRVIIIDKNVVTKAGIIETFCDVYFNSKSDGEIFGIPLNKI